jgi:hypothetical protein
MLLILVLLCIVAGGALNFSLFYFPTRRHAGEARLFRQREFPPPLVKDEHLVKTSPWIFGGDSASTATR